MFFSFDFQKFIFFEFCIYISHFRLFTDPIFMKIFVFSYYLFVLPSTPDLILNLLLLARGLLNCADYYSLSSGYLDHLVALLLLHYHLSSLFLSLVTPSLGLSSSHSPFLTTLLSHPRLWTHFTPFHDFTWLPNLLSHFWRLILFIRIRFLIFKIPSFKVSYIVIQ